MQSSIVLVWLHIIRFSFGKKPNEEQSSCITINSHFIPLVFLYPDLPCADFLKSYNVMYSCFITITTYTIGEVQTKLQILVATCIIVVPLYSMAGFQTL